MIVFPQGQLGNQLFGLACALYLNQTGSSKVYVFVSDIELREKIKSLTKHRLDNTKIVVTHSKSIRLFLELSFRFIEYLKKLQILNFMVTLLERFFVTTEIPWESPTDLSHSFSQKVVVRGYFQDVEMVMRLSPESKRIMAAVIKCSDEAVEPIKKDATGVHIRRGDYLGIPEYGTLGINYFEKIVANLPGIPSRLLIASDDPLALKDYKVRGNTVFLSPLNYSPLRTMEALASCKRFIMSNSTFSFWIGWYVSLHGGTVIAPRPWFKTVSVPENYLYLESFEQRESMFD